jgi:hypothetical protein
VDKLAALDKKFTDLELKYNALSAASKLAISGSSSIPETADGKEVSERNDVI